MSTRFANTFLTVTHFFIIKAVLNLLAVHVDAVIVILGVHDESSPLSPTRRNVGSVVFVEVFSEIPSPVAHV